VAVKEKKKRTATDAKAARWIVRLGDDHTFSNSHNPIINKKIPPFVPLFPK